MPIGLPRSAGRLNFLVQVSPGEQIWPLRLQLQVLIRRWSAEGSGQTSSLLGLMGDADCRDLGLGILMVIPKWEL